MERITQLWCIVCNQLLYSMASVYKQKWVSS